MSKANAQRQPLTDRNKMIITIVAICLVAVIAVSVTLGVLLRPIPVTPDNENPGDSNSSNLPVKNGDFALVGSDDTNFPKSALNWTRYGYQEKSGNTQGFESIDTTENVVMGIVDTDGEKWQSVLDDLAIEGIQNVENPNQHQLGANEKHSNSNVYMIASKNSTNAMIMSDSVSVSSTTSVKIGVWFNTAQLKSGKATIMVQNSSSTPNANEENRYAYEFDLPQNNEGWQYKEFYVFNRKTSTQYIRVSIGLGNSYTGANAEGVLFVDDISYETVTANDYRLKADDAPEGDTTYKIIEKEEDTTVAQTEGFVTLKELNDETNTPATLKYTDSNSYVKDAGYSPFTTKDDFSREGFGIYMLSNHAETKAPVALELTNTVTVSLATDDSTQDYHHFSFWVRTVSRNNNVLAFANVLVQRRDAEGSEWEEMSNGDFTVKTEQNIDKDTNNGWSKYDIYIKPGQTPNQIRLVFALGDVEGYENTPYTPDGDLYITTPFYETISNNAYNSASSGTASKKFDLTGNTATTSVSNGSFSSMVANTDQPSNWKPTFAGDNNLYLDGKGNLTPDGVDRTHSAVKDSGVITWTDESYPDDDERKVLKIATNSLATSYGYVSGDLTLTARNVYVFSVLAKLEGQAQPYFYLIKGGKNREEAVVGKVESVYTTAVDGSVFNQADEIYQDGSGNQIWTRYYIIYVAGNTDETVRLALFNGSIDGRVTTTNTTVYYDKVTMQTLGSYALTEDEDNKDQYKVDFTAGKSFTAFNECETVDDLINKLNGSKVEDDKEECINKELVVVEPSAEEWEEMRKVPEEDTDDEDDKDDTTDTKRDVNLALLFSILSSVLLVAVLLIVIIIRIYKKKKQ